jgi:hypothetical protein
MNDTELDSKAPPRGYPGGGEEPTKAYMGRVPSLHSNGLGGKRRGERGGADKDGAKKATRYELRLQGWQQIAPVLGWTVRTAIRHRQELREHKAIFYQWLGKPPCKTVCSYESLLRLFLITREDSAPPGRAESHPGAQPP